MPEDMPEDLLDRMLDRMLEHMSEYMPEDLPVRKSINVMVGITRSKVINQSYLILLAIYHWVPNYDTVKILSMDPVAQFGLASISSVLCHEICNP